MRRSVPLSSLTTTTLVVVVAAVSTAHRPCVACAQMVSASSASAPSASTASASTSTTVPGAVTRVPARPFEVSSLASLSSLGSGVALYFSPELSASQPGWRGGILFDEGVRDALRLGTHDGREIADLVSDVLLVTSMVQAGVIDATIAPLLQGDPDLALHAHTAHLFALGITLSLSEIVKHSVARARPFERECATNPSRQGCDDTADTYASFYSGHTSMAFTSAGFSCAMHLSRQLYGDPGADLVACASSFVLASGTGLLRIAADRHYLTDVLVGAVAGFAVGYLATLAIVPERGSGGTQHRSGFTAFVVPMVAPSVITGGTSGGQAGISAVGSF